MKKMLSYWIVVPLCLVCCCLIGLGITSNKKQNCWEMTHSQCAEKNYLPLCSTDSIEEATVFCFMDYLMDLNATDINYGVRSCSEATSLMLQFGLKGVYIDILTSISSESAGVVSGFSVVSKDQKKIYASVSNGESENSAFVMADYGHSFMMERTAFMSFYRVTQNINSDEQFLFKDAGSYFVTDLEIGTSTLYDDKGEIVSAFKLEQNEIDLLKKQINEKRK